MASSPPGEVEAVHAASARCHLTQSPREQEAAHDLVLVAKAMAAMLVQLEPSMPEVVVLLLVLLL